MIYDLPRTVEVMGLEYEIRSDFRPILDIMTALNDVDLDVTQKALAIIDIFYVDSDSLPVEHYEEALKQCFWFIRCGNEEQNRRKQPKLMDWEQDFGVLIAPINRVVGQEIRALPYLHWWSFVSYYYEIGDCYFAQIVRIRSMKAKGKRLDKADAEFYRDNREAIDFKNRYTEAETDILKKWGGA